MQIHANRWAVLAVAIIGCTSGEPTGTPEAGVGAGGAVGTGGTAGTGGGSGGSGSGGAAGAPGSGGDADNASSGGNHGSGGTAGNPGSGGNHGSGGNGSGGSGGPTCANPLPKPVCNGNPPFVNPATGATIIHDPSIVAEGCTFYGFSTGSVLPNRTSTDLVNWKSYGPPSFSLPAWVGSGAQIWAPDVHYANGKFWNYYSVWHGAVNTAQIGLLTNTTLDIKSSNYKWVDQGLVVDNATGGGSNVNVIDPDLFIDDDGSWWLVYGSFNNGIRLISLDPTTGLPKQKPVSPITLTDHLGEGSTLIKNHGYYYLFVSRGKCCAGMGSSYEVVYARASKVTGPYVTKSGRSFSTSSYQDSTDALMPVGFDGNTGGQGGQSIFKVNGQWYIDYHAYVAGTNPAKLVVRPLYFDASDWATFDCTKS